MEKILNDGGENGVYAFTPCVNIARKQNEPALLGRLILLTFLVRFLIRVLANSYFTWLFILFRIRFLR